MHGEEETRQKVDSDPESIRIGNMQAQACIGTKLMLSSFSLFPVIPTFQ
jgi:hypothetical protein